MIISFIIIYNIMNYSITNKTHVLIYICRALKANYSCIVQSTNGQKYLK